MTATNANSTPLLSPAEVDSLLIQPLLSRSVAAQVFRVVPIGSTTFRVPSITVDGTAAWTNEGAEIAVSDATFAEQTVTPSKLAGLTIVSNELAADSSPEAASVIGESLARDMARKLDLACFSTQAAPALQGLSTITPTSVVGGTGWGPALDVFEQAIAAAEDVGAEITGWVGGSAACLALALLKQGTTSNLPLLGYVDGGAVDAGLPARRELAGRPLYKIPTASTAVKTVWGICYDRVSLIVRTDAEITADSSQFFSSDRTAVRAKMRVGIAIPQPLAVVKVTVA